MRRSWRWLAVVSLGLLPGWPAPAMAQTPPPQHQPSQPSPGQQPQPAGGAPSSVYGPQPYPAQSPRQVSPRDGTAMAPRPAQGRQQVPLPQAAPRAPFQLTPQQHADLMRVLHAWEEHSARINTLWCNFSRWDYDAAFGPRDPQDPQRAVPKRIASGELKYAAPDKGLYRIAETQEFSGFTGAEPKFGPKQEGTEHWICDGQSIWEFNYPKKQLIERKLPPELQGKAITDGPLPFLFGAEADKLIERYFLRIVTPPTASGEIWLEAYPRYAGDAANFQRATLILDQRTLLPAALEVNLPNGQSRHVHQFTNHVVNELRLLQLFQGDFSKPALPRGWTKLEEGPGPRPDPARR